MLRQKRPTEIKVIGIVALVVGFFHFFGGLGLVTSAVSLSDIGVDVSGWEAETLGAISFGIGLYWFVLAGFCAITVLCLFLRLRFAWHLTIVLSSLLYIMGFLNFKEGFYVDGIVYVVTSTMITSLAYTEKVKWYLKKID
ncbi:MAG TPA: hypothetical protein VD699_04775 [Nitrosopumilaceae archaeon]|nr:hypothetical protein [Nitrosopumilaceae archaeon]